MSLQNLKEDFLYGLLPEGIISLDEQGLIQAVIGGYQDRMDDLRAYTSKLELLVTGVGLPETDVNGNPVNNAVVCVVQSPQGKVYNRSLQIDDTTPPNGDPTLVTWAGAQLQLDDKHVLISAAYGVDLFRLVDAGILSYLAGTIGAVLYHTAAQDPNNADSDARRLIQTWFPRLQFKGTAQSFETLGKLLGFDDVRMTPLWGRLSPRITNDIGDPQNDQDFATAPEFWPKQVRDTFYDPWVLNDGPFFTWNGTCSARFGTNDSSFYTQVVNGFNPFVSVTVVGTAPTDPVSAQGPFILVGGGPETKASVTPPGSGLLFEAISVGSSFNGLQLGFQDVSNGTSRLVTINDRLSAIKYRTSFYDLALTMDFDHALAQFGTNVAQTNRDLSNNPTVANFGSTALSPFRPWMAGSVAQPLIQQDYVTQTVANGNLSLWLPRNQADLTVRELDHVSITSAGAQVTNAMEEVRPATRRARHVYTGYLITDQAGYAKYNATEDLTNTAIGSSNVSMWGTLQTAPLSPFAVQFYENGQLMVSEVDLTNPNYVRITGVVSSGTFNYSNRSWVLNFVGTLLGSPRNPSLFSTGLAANGVVQPYNVGAVDAHYTLISSPDPTFKGPTCYVTDTTPPNFLYDSSGTNSAWTDPNPITNQSLAGGDYTFRTVLNLDGFAIGGLVINGTYGTDDQLRDIKVNGTSTGIVGASPNYSPFASRFSLNNPAMFVSGSNTLDFVVRNLSGPIALRIEMVGTATPLPDITASFYPTSTEVIRSDPVYGTLTTGYQVRPEDQFDDPVLDMPEEYPWRRDYVGGGELVDFDTYSPPTPDIAVVPLSNSVSTVSQTGAQYDVTLSILGAQPPHFEVEARDLDNYVPGQRAIAYTGTFRSLSNPPQQRTIISIDAEAYWTFDTLQWLDSTDNNHNLTDPYSDIPLNNAGVSPALINRCADMSGGDNNHVLYVPYTPDLAAGSGVSFTCIIWAQMKFQSAGSAMIGNTGADQNASDFVLWEDLAGNITLLVHTIDAQTISISTNHQWFGDGSWHFYAFGYDDTLKQLWLQFDNGPRVSAPCNGVRNTGQPFTIGNFGLTGGHPMLGFFDEAGFWHRSLTRLEISTIYNAGIGMQYPFNPASPWMTRSGGLDESMLPGWALYHFGLVQGVLVADPTKFFGDHHRTGLLLWYPLNDHPRDALQIIDRSASASNPNIVGLNSTDRVFDPVQGWYLSPKPGFSATSVFPRGNSGTLFAGGFWIRSASSPAQVIFQTGPLVIQLSGTNLIFLFNNADGTQTTINTRSFTAASWTYFAWSFDGTNFTIETFDILGTNIETITVTSGTANLDLSAPDTIVLSCPAQTFDIRDIRLWDTTKTKAQLQLASYHSPNPTKALYRPAMLQSANNYDLYGVRVLPNGYVEPDLLPVATITDKFAWVQRYDYLARYVAQERFKEVGLGSGNTPPKTQRLGTQWDTLTGAGTVVTSTWRGQFLGGSGTWFGDNPLGQLITLVEASATDFGILGTLASTGTTSQWPNPLQATNVCRERIWVVGDDHYVWGVGVTKTSVGTAAFSTEKLFTSSGSEQPTGDEMLFSTALLNGTIGFKLNVSVAGSVYAGTYFGTVTSPPLFLYANEENDLNLSGASAVNAWINPNAFGLGQTVPVAAIQDNGQIGFQVNTTLQPGFYRLQVTSGNIGKVDSGFDGYQVVITVGDIAFQAVLCAGQTGANFSTTDTIEFYLPHTLPGSPSSWLLTFDWSNALRDNQRGTARQLAISGFSLTRHTTTLYQVSLGTNAVSLTPMSVTSSDFGSTPGGWFAAMTSWGTVASYAHESTVYSSNDTVQANYPMSNQLTATTGERRSDIIMAGSFTLFDTPNPAMTIYGPLAFGSGVILVSPGTVSYGNVTLGNTADGTFTVFNVGAGLLTGNATTSSPFSIIQNGNYSIQPGQSLPVVVRFTPGNVIVYNGAVTFTGAAGATGYVTGNGSFGPGPALMYDTIESYTVGTVFSDGTLNGGVGFYVAWGTGSNTNVMAQDNLLSYPTGSVTVGELSAGNNWGTAGAVI